MIVYSNTSLWLEITWTIFQYVIPTLQLYFMLDPYVQLDILLHDQWMTWVVNSLFAIMTIMNWDYLFGKTARYFEVISEK